MEPSATNNKKELRVQELLQKSVKKCAQAAKEQMSTGIFICTLLPILMFLVFVNPPMMWLKGVSVVALTLMCALSFRIQVKVTTHMSKANDVDELLSINEKIKKYKKISYGVGLLLMSVAFVILHYKGSVNATLMRTLPFAIVMTIAYAISGFIESKDYPEIKEIKEIMQK